MMGWAVSPTRPVVSDGSARGGSEPDDIVAAVDVDHLAGDPAREVAGEEDRRAGHLLGFDVAFQRRALGDLSEDVGKA